MNSYYLFEKGQDLQTPLVFEDTKGKGPTFLWLMSLSSVDILAF